MAKRRMSGEGSVFQRSSDGAWIAQLSIGPRHERRYVSRSARTKKLAQGKLKELRDSGGVAPSRMTVGDFLDQWCRDARNIRPATRASYRAAILTHIAPALGSIRVVDLTAAHVDTWLRLEGERVGTRTLQHSHAVLRRALVTAVRQGIIPRNVAGREFVDAPKVVVDEPRSLTQDEADRLLAVCRGDRLEFLFVLALGTGLRQGEILGLAWEDVTPEGVSVRKELARIDGKYQRVEPKTPASRRFVPFSGSVAAGLERHRARVIADGFVPTRTGPVFTNTTGGALNGSWLTHRFYDLLAEAGIDRLPFRNLRTTFASRLYDAGVPDHTIAQLMGHTRTHTTRRNYIARTPEQAVAAIERLVAAG